MWYFTWVLGLAFACAFAILNALWHDTKVAEEEAAKEEK